MFPFHKAKKTSQPSLPVQLARLKDALRAADAVVLGAGAGLSTAAGYTYTGARFEQYFSDFAAQYGFRDMYSGGFYPYASPEAFWGFWCRYIWINRYAPIPSDLYEKLLALIKDKDYFVLTTNVDHCFQRSGFDKNRLFYTQGDYGLLQSSEPRGVTAHKTYDNEALMREMLLAEGYKIASDGTLSVPAGTTPKMTIPSGLVPVCPDDGAPMTTNLRADDRFVEDAGWHAAADRYERFLSDHGQGRVLYLELGVGNNTPVIIKYPFWNFTAKNPRATYASVNLGSAVAPAEIQRQSILIDADIQEAIEAMRK